MTHSLTTLFLTLTALVALFFGTPGAAQDVDWLEQVDSYVEAQVQSAGLPGAAVAVVTPDGLIYARGFGQTRLDGGAPVTPDTPFEIGSLTKSMTALAILQLHAEGRLELDDPVRTYLPWFRVADEDASEVITLRHLLSHTSGLPANSHAVVWQDFKRIDASSEAAVRALATVRLQSEPGEAFAYANMGYAALGLVIEAVTGQSWAAYVEEHILEALDMHASSASVAERDVLGVAQPYGWRLGRRVAAAWTSPFMAPAGSTMVASAQDMARYLQAWLEPQASEAMPAGVQRAFDPQIASGGGEHYGMGWGMQERHGETLVYHTGGTVGSSAFMSVLPGKGVGVVVLTNAVSIVPVMLGMGINDLVLGHEPAPIGVDAARVMTYLLTGVGVLGLALLLWAVARALRVVRRGWRRRRLWVQFVRTAILVSLAAALWLVVPSSLAASGLPYPFGLRGYPADIAFGVGMLLLASGAWALYGTAALAFARHRPVRRQAVTT